MKSQRGLVSEHDSTVCHLGTRRDGVPLEERRMDSPVVVPFVAFAGWVKLDSTKLRKPFLQFPGSPVKPLSHTLISSYSIGLHGEFLTLDKSCHRGQRW